MTLRERGFPVIMEELYWCRFLARSFAEVPVTLTNADRVSSFGYRPSVLRRTCAIHGGRFVACSPEPACGSEADRMRQTCRGLQRQRARNGVRFRPDAAGRRVPVGRATPSPPSSSSRCRSTCARRVRSCRSSIPSIPTSCSRTTPSRRARSGRCVQHFDAYAEWLVQRIKPERVVEFGCNDGILLAPLAARGVKAVGVDISENITAMAARKGLDVITGYFDPATAAAITSKHRTGRRRHRQQRVRAQRSSGSDSGGGCRTR